MSRIVLTVTDTIIGVTKGVTLPSEVAAAIFAAAEVGLDGADEDSTPFSNDSLEQAFENVTSINRFLRYS